MELRVRKYEALPRKSQAKERGFRNGSADTRIVCSPPSPSWICQWAAPGAWLRGFATASIFSFPIPSPFQSPWPPNHVSCLVVNAALESGVSIRLKYVGPSKLSHEEIFRPPLQIPSLSTAMCECGATAAATTSCPSWCGGFWGNLN